jgi:plastocyanin
MKGLPPVPKLLAVLAAVAAVTAIFASLAFARHTKSVHAGDNFFTKGSVTIKRGSAVHWSWSGTENQHNVTSKKGDRFHSRTGTTVSFTHVFRKRGTFTIICTKHPSQMRMRVRVV